jgi:nucleoside-diphosphate-sugar epimerase
MANNRIIENSIKYSAKGAKIIYFSTMSVYGEPRPERFFNRPGAYGKEKLHGERYAIRMGRKYGKQVFVLRLGHVCGDLQNITYKIREIIKAGSVYMPSDGQILSNTIYTATIAEAICNIASGLEQPGVYDLMCVPQWAWRDVYGYEANRIGQILQVENIGEPKRKRLIAFFKRLPKQLISAMITNAFIKEAGNKILSRMPENLNMCIKASYSKARAKGEIAGLSSRQMSHSALSWDPVGSKYLASLSKTKDLLEKKNLFKIPERIASKAFPPDIPYYAF